MRLTSQPWHQVGAGPTPIGAATTFDGLVDQLSALLGARLRDLLVARLAARTSVGGGGPDCGEDEYLRHDEPTGHHVLTDDLARSVRAYVAGIGQLYNAVAFHSFEHATHVTISANKLLSMITGSNRNGAPILRAEIKKAMSDRHMLDRHNHVEDLDFSFGIQPDPRIMFAVVFAALVHDVGHMGVPNSVLVDEEDELAILHNDVSVAEQNSLQVAFSMLQREEFAALKRCICPNPEERKFFRKKVISMVMVTDISDQERIQIVASRWNAAFPSKSTENPAGSGGEEGAPSRGGSANSTSQQPAAGRDEAAAPTMPSSSRRVSERVVQSQELKSSLTRRRFSMFATDGAAKEFANERRSYRRLGIRCSMDFSGKLLDAYRTNDQLQQHAVLETIMNVADVAHTMQSFPVFCKWNRRLFREFYLARRAGRLCFDPEENWYNGQISFLSHYIIPLSQKMKTCGVFGTTGYVFEYFAVENKKRWIEEGKTISADIIREAKEEVEGEHT